MKQIDYSKYEGHTPGPWRQSGLPILADNSIVFAWMPYDGGYFVNDNDYALVEDAPMLLEECRKRDKEIEQLRGALTQIIHLIVRSSTKENNNG